MKKGIPKSARGSCGLLARTTWKGDTLISEGRRKTHVAFWKEEHEIDTPKNFQARKKWE